MSAGLGHFHRQVAELMDRPQPASDFLRGRPPIACRANFASDGGPAPKLTKPVYGYLIERRYSWAHVAFLYPDQGPRAAEAAYQWVGGRSGLYLDAAPGRRSAVVLVAAGRLTRLR